MAPRKEIPKPYNGGTWTESKFNSWIRGQLRRSRWPQKYEAIRRAYVKDGINPRTGRKCKLHECASCGELFPAKDIKADHIVPVVGPEGFVDWNTFIARLYVDADGFQALCKECHDHKTAEERAERKAYKDKHQ